MKKLSHYLLCRIEIVLNLITLTPLLLNSKEAHTLNDFLVRRKDYFEQNLTFLQFQRFELMKAKAQLFWTRWRLVIVVKMG